AFRSPTRCLRTWCPPLPGARGAPADGRRSISCPQDVRFARSGGSPVSRKLSCDVRRKLLTEGLGARFLMVDPDAPSAGTRGLACREPHLDEPARAVRARREGTTKHTRAFVHPRDAVPA